MIKTNWFTAMYYVATIKQIQQAFKHTSQKPLINNNVETSLQFDKPLCLFWFVYLASDTDGSIAIGRQRAVVCMTVDLNYLNMSTKINYTVGDRYIVREVLTRNVIHNIVVWSTKQNIIIYLFSSQTVLINSFIPVIYYDTVAGFNTGFMVCLDQFMIWDFLVLLVSQCLKV